MTAMRVFGSKKGAGVQVREAQATKPIQSGPLGTTVIVGAFRSGPTDQVVEMVSGEDFYRRVCGGLTQDSEAPLAAEHFYEQGQGAGVLWCLRVTDGSEIKAAVPLYSRDVERGLAERRPTTKPPAAVMTLDAHNGGRWGGRRRVKTGDVNLSTAISSNTVDLGFATQEDAWVGASLSFPNDDASATFTVTANTSAGVFTIAGDWTDAVELGTDGRYQLELTNTHELTGNPEFLAVEVGDSGETTAGFSLYAWRDGAQVKRWENVDLDSSGDRYWHTAIEDDTDNYEIAVQTDTFTGDPSDPYQRPANYAEIPAPGGVTANSLTFQVIRWDLTGSSDLALDSVNDITWGSTPRACTIVLTFTNATDYTVAATFADGQTADNLPTGTVGTAYASQNAYLPGFTVHLPAGGTSPSASDTFTIYVRTLPEDLAGKSAWLYVAAGPDDGDTAIKYRVTDNDHESVTLSPVEDITGEVTAPGAPTMTGTIAGPFNLTGGGQTLVFTVGESGPYTLTNTLTGGAETTTALAAELQGLENTRAGSAADALVTFTVSSDDKLIATAAQDYGSSVSLDMGAGTLNAIVGFTDGQTAAGAEPTIARLQWVQEMGGGYDGLADLGSTDYQAAWDRGSSPLNDMEIINTGLVRYSTPGVTDADAQTAMMLYAYEYNGMAVLEIPDTVTTEAGAIAWHKANLAIGPSQDYTISPWPSYVKIRNPYGKGLYTAPVSGLYLGETARLAVASNGYHTNTTIDSLISPIVKELPTGDRRLDNELLNGYGFVEIRKRGPKVYIWGARIIGDGSRSFINARATKSHVGRTLLTNTDALVFSLINEDTFAEVKKLLYGLFEPWYRAGWFDDSDGPNFSDQVLIKVDASNNPATQRALGNLHAGISFDVVKIAERVIFTIGPKGVVES